MPLTGVHHIALIASDYERSKHFYVAILGLEVITEHYREARKSYKLDLRGPGGIQLELFSFPCPPRRVSNPEACGLRHLAFSVSDLDAEIERLHSFDIECEEVRIDEYTGRRFTFLRDPDGLPLELYEVDRWVQE